MPSPRFAAIVRARDELAMRVAVACAQVAALLWFAWPTGLPLDDAWIHQVVARTFAETGTLGYAPGEHGAAATSYLWAALLAVNFKVLHVSPVAWAFLLNAAASVGTGQLLYALLKRGSESGSEGEGGSASGSGEELAGIFSRGAVVALACSGGNVLWYAHSGMEAAVFVALSMTAVWAVTTPGASVGRTALAGTAAGLVMLTRPEGAPLCAIVVGYLVLRRRGAARIGAALGPAVVAACVYFGSNLAKTGHATPATLSGRRWLWFEITYGLSGLDRAADFVEAWAERLSSYTFDTGALGAWIMIALAAYGAVRLLRAKNDGVRLLFTWAALHSAAYVLLLPTPGHGGRYQPFVPLLYTACIALGTMFLVGDALRSTEKSSRWLAVAAVIPWFVFSFATTGTLRHSHALAVAHIEGTELAMGRFVDTLPAGGTVASFDIGGIGWATRRPILDAGGLSDPRTAALLERGRLWEHLKSRDVRYVVLPETWERVLPVVDRFISRLHLDNPAVRLTRLHETETPYERWLPAIASTWNAAPKQVLYRIEYTGDAGPEDVPLQPPDARRALRDDARMVRERERLQTEHALAVLAAWHVPVSVQVTPAPSKAASASGGEATCSVQLGMWGLDAAGCDAVANPAVLRSVLYEITRRYLDVGDLGGALRALPHALAMAKRAHEPRFHPPLAPLVLPGSAPRDRSLPWGLPLALAIVAALTLMDAARARRLRRASEKEPKTGAAATLAASAAALSLSLSLSLSALVLVVATTAGCSHERELLHAVPDGVGAVDLALAHGANVEAHDGGGRTPLIVAAGRGDVDVLGALLAHGARVDARDGDGATALHHAARGGHHACVLVLLRAGALIDALAGLRHRSALHDASLAGSIEAVRLLLSGGSDPSLADSFGETPLHLLAHAEPSRSALIAPLLLAKSAGAGAAAAALRDARGFTPAHVAAVQGNVPLLQELARASLAGGTTPSGEGAADTAMRYGKERAADFLLRSGARLRDPTALPPLHDAARMDAVWSAADLLGAGADPSFSYAGKTAIDVARESGSRHVLSLFTAAPATAPSTPP